MEVSPKISPFVWYIEIADTFSYKNMIDFKYLAALVIFALAMAPFHMSVT